MVTSMYCPLPTPSVRNVTYLPLSPRNTLPLAIMPANSTLSRYSSLTYMPGMKSSWLHQPYFLYWNSGVSHLSDLLGVTTSMPTRFASVLYTQRLYDPWQCLRQDFQNFSGLCAFWYANADISLPRLTACALHRPKPDSDCSMVMISSLRGWSPNFVMNCIIFSSFFFANARLYMSASYLSMPNTSDILSMASSSYTMVSLIRSLLQSWNMVAFLRPDTATGLISAVPNTQSLTLFGLIALNSLRMAGLSACVTPNTSPRHKRSEVAASSSG